MNPLDHLIVACTDLAEGVRHVEDVLGVEAFAGGQHPGRGTRNALVSLGPDAYLEIIGVDPLQPPPPEPRWLGVDEPGPPRLVSWAVKAPDLLSVVERARAAGIELGQVGTASRRNPDGSELSWEFTDPTAPRAGGVIPFFMRWGGSAHPAATLPASCSFLDIAAEHPQADDVRRIAEALEIDMTVAPGDRPKLTASIQSPRGVVQLG